MTEQERLAAALAYQGATAAPPTMAQQLGKVPSRLVGALKALGTGSSYGSAEPVNAVNDLARTKFWRGSVFGVPEDVQQRNQARAMEAVSMAAPIVYHGSPHRFAPTVKNPLGEFDLTKIGSGEGAQAYGYGHYVAEAPNVAKDYAAKLSKSIVDFTNTQPSNKIEQALKKQYEELADRTQVADRGQAILDLWKRHAKPTTDLLYGNSYLNIPPMNPEQLAKQLKIRDAAQRLGEPIYGDSGALYKVDLPDEVVPRMLDWDKPLSQQHPDVQAALAKIDKDTYHPQGGDYSPEEQGQMIYMRLANSPLAKNKVEAAELLKRSGIPGIKYLDAGSRGASTGTRNFVVFPGNEGLLNILGRE